MKIDRNYLKNRIKERISIGECSLEIAAHFFISLKLAEELISEINIEPKQAKKDKKIYPSSQNRPS